jgi:signal transduction histidine kinase
VTVVFDEDPLPAEGQRLAAVRRYHILDTPPDGAFDRVVALASRICAVPISTISIVDEDRIWFKSAVGLAGVEQIDREPGLCASAILHDGPYVVADAAVDPRTLNNSLVRGELGLRFYAAVPLRTHDGYQLGTLNVIDRQPREITDEQIASLQDLAAIVVDELELRLAARHAVEFQSLRAASEVRDAIVTGITHEMRTPIAVLQGLSELPPVDTDDGEELHGLFRRHVHRLGQLVEQFLDFTHLEDGNAPVMELAATDVGELVADAIDLHADRATFVVDAPAGLPPASIDRARTLSVVSELVNNAIRFGPPGGPVRVDVTADADAVRVAVEDRGPGIAPEALPYVLDQHYRSPHSSGRGLGLYVANAIATAQGASIEVASPPASGARFTLVLPRADTDRAG